MGVFGYHAQGTRVPPLCLLRGLSVSKQLLSVMYNIFSTVFFAVCANFIAHLFKKTIGTSFTVCDYNSRVTW